VRALAAAGRRDEALTRFDQIPAAGGRPSPGAAAALLAACERAGAWADGVRVWKAAASLAPPGGDAAASSRLLAAGRSLVYAFPGLLTSLPPGMVRAAQTVVASGAAARAFLSGGGSGGGSDSED